MQARQAYGRGDWVSVADPRAPHETRWLALEIAQARAVLGVLPRWPLSESVQRTMRWYRRFGEGADARALCDAEIDDFERNP
jgi:CDP-glucose 4,6-dehydratase